MEQWLSKHELLICRYSHLSYEEIGKKINSSPRTVKYHTDRIRLKLGVDKKRHIQDRCRELGIKLEEDA